MNRVEGEHQGGNRKEIEYAFRESLREIPEGDGEGTQEDFASEFDNDTEDRFNQDQQEMEQIRQELGIEDVELEIPPYLDGAMDKAVDSVFEGTDEEVESEESNNIGRIREFAGQFGLFLNNRELIEKYTSGFNKKHREQILNSVDAYQAAEPFINEYLGTRGEIDEEELKHRLDRIKDLFKKFWGDSEVEHMFADDYSEEKKGVREKLKGLLSFGVDFVPIVGPAKMIAEAKAGRTLAGDELKGWRRSLHALEGGAFLVLDITGIGVAAKGITKGSQLGGKVFTRSAAMARKLGMSSKVYKPLFRTGTTIAKHPVLSRVVNHSFSRIVSRRANRLRA